MKGNRWLYRFDNGVLLLGKLSGTYGGKLTFTNQLVRREGDKYSGCYVLIVPYSHECPKRYRRRARGKWRQLENVE